MYQILIVDEEEHLLWALEKNLFPERDDIQIVTARSGGEGLKILGEEPIDLLVSDIKMPGPIDGFQLILRAKEVAPDARVIIMTAFGTNRIQNLADRIGITHYIEKPFNISDLRDAVLEVLDEREGFQGVLSDLELTDIIQMLCLAKRTALLHLKHKDHRGKIVFERGDVTHAEFDDHAGEEAVYRMLALRQGDIYMQSDFHNETRSIEMSWQDLLLEGVKRVDEHRLEVSEPRIEVAAQAHEPNGAVERSLSDAIELPYAASNQVSSERRPPRLSNSSSGVEEDSVSSYSGRPLFSEEELDEIAHLSESAVAQSDAQVSKSEEGSEGESRPHRKDTAERPVPVSGRSQESGPHPIDTERLDDNRGSEPEDMSIDEIESGVHALPQAAFDRDATSTNLRGLNRQRHKTSSGSVPRIDATQVESAEPQSAMVESSVSEAIAMAVSDDDVTPVSVPRSVGSGEFHQRRAEEFTQSGEMSLEALAQSSVATTSAPPEPLEGALSAPSDAYQSGEIEIPAVYRADKADVNDSSDRIPRADPSFVREHPDELGATRSEVSAAELKFEQVREVETAKEVLSQFLRECPGLQTTGIFSMLDGLALDFVHGMNSAPLDSDVVGAFFRDVVTAANRTVGSLEGERRFEELQLVFDGQIVLLRTIPNTPYVHIATISRQTRMGIAVVLMRRFGQRLSTCFNR